MNYELHNPAGLTPEQYGAADGWRLLDEDEFGDINERIYHTSWYDPNDESWSDVGGYFCSDKKTILRTKLTRAELRAARGIPEQPVSDTPETDEEAWFDNDEGWWVSRSVSRRMERGRKCAMDQVSLLEGELAAAQRENAELRAELENSKRVRKECAERIAKEESRSSGESRARNAAEEHCKRISLQRGEALARAEAAEVTVTKLREALEQQHKWHLDQTDRTPVYFGDTIGQINAEEYGDSELYKITDRALNP